ncbi:MAG: hypothetical protein A3J24_00385 [Deltaproteobacteria bacterium RIFCSPLOWO2_02_FULL_53_8]|nr:MAG: hypothetical protein A3J24_00385 [Deltaproteobacteria bacterium RIFCSPLOWO2_02_FULL_53_8]
MKAKEVPQEESVLEGNRRACYAQDESGRYVVVPSKGWEVEKVINDQAHVAIDRPVEAARRSVIAGEASPLLYHMLRCQMSAGLLAATVGIWGWRVKRHLKPAPFASLNDEMLSRYADALGMSVAELKTVPSYPPHESVAGKER